MRRDLRVWLPAVRAGSGADVFTARLARLLESGGCSVQLTWLPHWVEAIPELANIDIPARTQIVHANSWNAFAFGGAKAVRVVTVHHCVHDPAFDPYKTMLQGLYHRYRVRSLERRSLESASAVTADSDYTRRSVLREFGPRDIEVVPLWVDTEALRPGPASPPGRAFRLLFTGNWGLRKGTDVLPELMRSLGPAFELTFTTGLRGRPPAVALPDNMRWAGAVADEAGMLELYHSCDAVVVPSRLEGFGYAAAEAMACGKPVVAFDTSSLPEVVEHGVTGRLVPVDDIAAMAAAIRELANDAALRRRMGEAARERAVRKFSGAQALARFLAVYDAALAR